MPTQPSVIRRYASKKGRVRMTPAIRAMTDEAWKARRDLTCEAMAESTARSYQEWNSEKAEAGINPVGVIEINADSICFELRMDIVDSIEGLVWKAENEGKINKWKVALATGMIEACRFWRDGVAGMTITVDMDGNLVKRPTQ